MVNIFLRSCIWNISSYLRRWRSVLFKKNTWLTGSGQEILFDDVCKTIKRHTMHHGKVYVGTDSFINGKNCIVANAICLHGADNQKGGKYFFKKNKINKKRFSTLLQRILHEVEDSIKVSSKICEMCPDIEIELHIDVSNKNSKTSKFAKFLTQYARSSGFDCKIKPYAWASASVADKHSK